MSIDVDTDNHYQQGFKAGYYSRDTKVNYYYMTELFEQRLINILQFDTPFLVEARLGYLVEDIRNSEFTIEKHLIEKIKIAAETFGLDLHI